MTEPPAHGAESVTAEQGTSPNGVAPAPTPAGEPQVAPPVEHAVEPTAPRAGGRAAGRAARGRPGPVTTPAGLAAAVARLAAGTGPVAVDAERASGYRYGQRAYLVQLRREGAGTVLVDPIALPDLAALGDAIADVEWVLHAASQDLPCLAEVGMRPRTLFDTELAGRLPATSGSGSARWSRASSGSPWRRATRPPTGRPARCRESWLRVRRAGRRGAGRAARPARGAAARGQGKLDWAHEEFAALAAAPPPAPRAEPWRRTSGIHRVRGRRALAVVRALWEARDALARQRDIAPGRVLPDSAIVAAATANPATAEELAALPVFCGRQQLRQLRRWFGAVAAARALPDEALPLSAVPSDGPPPPNRWADRDPDAAARLVAARAALADAVRPAVDPGGEPALPRPGPPAGLGATRRRRPGRGRRGARRRRRPALAGRAGRAAARGCGEGHGGRSYRRVASRARVAA